MRDFSQSESLTHILTGPNVMKILSALVGPNISPHYISITFVPLHFKCNYICHNLSGFTAWSTIRPSHTLSFNLMIATMKHYLISIVPVTRSHEYSLSWFILYLHITDDISSFPIIVMLAIMRSQTSLTKNELACVWWFFLLAKPLWSLGHGYNITYT